MSTAWWYWWRISPRGPRTDGQARMQGSAGAAVELVALPHLERRVEGHRPAGRVVVVGLRAAQLVDHPRGWALRSSGTPLNSLFSLTDPSGPPSPLAPLSETTTTRVLSRWPGLLQVVKQPPDVVVSVRQEPGVHLGHPGSTGASRPRTGSPTAWCSPAEGMACPPGPVRSAGVPIGLSGGSSVSPRDDAHLLARGPASARASPRSPCRTSLRTARSSPAEHGVGRALAPGA